MSMESLAAGVAAEARHLMDPLDGDDGPEQHLAPGYDAAVSATVPWDKADVVALHDRAAYLRHRRLEQKS